MFFLSVFAWGAYRDNAVKKQMYRELSTLMQQNDILLDTGNINETGEMFRLDTNRDSSQEQRLVEALLGGETVAQQGGGGVITAYIGESGEAEFRTGGEFDVVFTKDIISSGDNVESMTKELLQIMSVEAASIEIAETEETVTATAMCAWNDYSVFDCSIQFTYINGGLKEISGKYISNIRKTDEKTQMSTSSAATALTRFLYEVIKEEKFECLAITDVSPGYRFVAAVYGDGSLRPVWRIEADSGVFFVDAVTGDVEQAFM